MRKRNGGRRVIKEDKHLINDKIRAREVRLVGDNVQMGIYSVSEALSEANTQGLDLVQISDKGETPTCKIVDYRKMIFDMEKNQKQQKSPKLKEIKFTPNTSEHDISYRVERGIKFLGEGHRVKATVFFKGRNIAFKERGESHPCKDET
jgi:translation initiation factor IF-3